MTFRGRNITTLGWALRPVVLVATIAVFVALTRADQRATGWLSGDVRALTGGATKTSAASAESGVTPIDQVGAVATQQYSGDGLSVRPTDSGARLRSDFQKLNGDATRGGLWVTSTVPGEDARLRMMATAMGRDARSTRFAGSGRVTTDHDIARFTRPGIVEEYATSVDGVRQDFIIDRRPSGTGRLQVDLALTGATAEQAPRGAKLRLDGSGRELVYSRLRVTDASGRVLTATLDVVAANRLAIRVDDADAVYPVRIDPTFSDADWVSMNPGVAGTNGTVSAMVTDASNNLYIGGTFTLVGTVLANNIAKWDGTAWTTLGTGSTNGTGNSVAAMVASGNDIYVGGIFGSAGGVANTLRIAKWNGSAWSALGTGANNTVSAFMMSGGTLYAGGSFTTIGGVTAGGLATWNGTAWSAFGGSGVNGGVGAFATIGTDVYIGCNCTLAGGVAVTRIAKWSTTTSTWSAVGTGNTGVVTALGVLGGELYAGASGNFTTTTGTPTGIAKWNPSTSQWLSLGTGTNFGGLDALLVHGGNVYIGGRFTTVNGVSAVNIAKWNGTSWSALGTGTEGPLPGHTPTVNALAMVGGDLYAGGTFLSMGGSAAHGLGKWNGSAWSPVATGLDHVVNAMVMHGTTLYIGGNFISAPNGVTVNRIAKWNGTTWSALGTGVNHLVNSLAVDASGNLYAGGRFSIAGGVAASLIAKWNGTAWSALGSGITGNVSVLAIAVNSAGDVFAGGNFNGAAAGGVPNTNRIAKWNGTAWSALGTGFADGLVSAIATIGTDVYVGGSFTLAGALPVNRLAKWSTTTSSWSAFGAGMNNNVNALTAVGTNLYVGGGFTTADGVAANRVAKWDGSAWSALGGGVVNTVNALAVDNGGRLYAGGGVIMAKWDGTAWSTLGSGVPGNVLALAADASGHLFVGGTFNTVGAGTLSPYIARADVNVNHAPVANAGVDQTVAATSASGATVVLNGTASSDPDGDTLASYSWTNDFDGTTLTGTTPSKLVPFGPHVFTLTVTDPGGMTSTDTVLVTVADVFTISIVTPPLAPATYTFGQAVAASYSCSDTAGILTSCVGTVANGANLATSSLGSQAFNVTATNSRGDTSSLGRTYTVTQASSTVTVTCPTSVTYTGAAQTPCTAAANGAGMAPVDVSASLAYVNNTSVGTVTVSASWAGGANHTGNAGLGNFTITRKPLTATLTANSKVYDGTTAEPNAAMNCSFPGVLPIDSANVTCTATAGTFDSASVGTPRTVTATVTLGGSAAGNYTLGAAGTAVTSTTAITAATVTTAAVVYGQAGDFTTVTANTGGLGPASLSSPRGVTADAAGNIYVADITNHRVLFFPFGQTTATRVYGQGGSFTSSTANLGGVSANSLSNPNRVTVDSTGLYVSDNGNRRVLYFPGSSTTATRVYGQGGSFISNGVNTGGLSADSLASTGAIAIDAGGNVYIADSSNQRLLFYPAGTTTATRVYGQNGSFTTNLVNNTGGVSGVVSADSLNAPNGIRLDTAGNLYVADGSNNRVLFYPAGQTTATVVYGQGDSFATNTANNGGVSADSLNGAVNLVLDAGNNLYVADTANHRVLFFPSGQTTATAVYGQAGSFITNTLNNGGVSADSLRSPNSVDLDFAGNIYISDQGNNRVLRFSGSAPAITPAALTITATSATKTYGATYTVTAGYTGFVNGETSAVLSSQPVCSSAGAAASANVGTYATTCSGAAGANYSISYVAGTLTVGAAPVTATLTAAGKTYDGTTAEPNAALSCTLDGVLAADSANVSCTATAGTFDSAAAGARTVTATVTIGGSASGNYTLGAAGTTVLSTSATASATIAKADATISVAGYTVTYDGAPHTATGSATGVSSEDLSALLHLGDTTHTDAGNYLEDEWTFDGNTNYNAATGIVENHIAKATSTTTVTCPVSETYTGSALTPCSATVIGAGGLSLTPAPSYTNNINVGTATASYAYAGDANHDGSDDSATFEITKASSTTTVTCPVSATYTGSPLTVCTASVTGAGGLSLTPTPAYVSNTNVGTATASYSYTGDANHDVSNASDTFEITKASSTTAVTCSVATTVYTGSALELCSATVTGAGGLSLTPTPTYANNINVGTATASYAYGGDANHDVSTASATFAITLAPSTTTVTCAPVTTVYTGAAQELCSATVTGIGGLSLTPTPTYANNTNVGTATASYSYAGDANHDVSNTSATFAITLASSTTTVTCAPLTTVYNGTAQELCSATVTGIGGLSLTPTPVYTNNTNVGTAAASYAYGGDANHDVSTASATFAITLAPSTTTVTCAPLTTVYTGAAQELCSATVTGIGGLSLTPTPTYTNNTNVGTATASYSYAGDANHDVSNASATFAITLASSTTTVTCAPLTTVYTGGAQELCSATVTGIGGLSLTPIPTYANNVNVGTATASYAYGGDANHDVSTASATFAITLAPSTTTVTCAPVTTVYTGAAQELCSATVTGAGGLSLTPTPTYTNNIDVGTATASYSYAGDANHDVSNSSATFAITLASSTTTVTCAPLTTVYTGGAQELCSATVTGIGGLSLTPIPTYANNVNVGTATASYAYGGDANHDVSTASATFAITLAPSTTTVTCAPVTTVYTGAAQELCSATVTGAGGLSLTPTPTYTNNIDVGTATASYSYAGDANHDVSNSSATFAITLASSTTTVTCAPLTTVYTGGAQELCSATVTGIGGLSLTPIPTYANNVNVGTATASYAYGGDANHDVSTASATFAITLAPSTTTVTCAPVTTVYTGAAQEICSATVTGIGGLSLTPTPTYTSNTNVGTATASYSYAGDANHDVSTASATFAITLAPSTTTVTCAPVTTVYTGAAQELCSATVTGIGGLSLTPIPTYANNVNVGTATASYAYGGDANHDVSTASATFAITLAPSTTTVTCAPVTTVYTGAAQELCSATVTGIGGLSLTPTPTYTNNTNVGTATASYAYGGDANHDVSTASATFAITVASSTTTVTCAPPTTVYTGAAQELCSATVTGIGGLSLTPTPTYTSNINVGTATASYSYAGDANHDVSNASATFAITLASSTTTVTCAPVTTVYTGAAQELCSATVTGIGGLSLTPTPVYTNNTNVGTATASYTYAGDANHDVSNASATFAITLAPSTTTVTCAPLTTVYTGAVQELCSATVTGIGGLSLTPTPVYTNNTNVGTATASYSYAGDANHDVSNASATFAITLAPSTTTVTCAPLTTVYTGAAQELCSATVTGIGGLSLTPTPVYTNNTNVGTATASYSYAGDANHDVSNASATFAITLASSTTTVTCAPLTTVYTGAVQELCSATVTGIGGLSLTPTPVYTNNTNVGTATASYSYAGDANHDVSNASATFAITLAPSTTTVTCAPLTTVYTGAAQELCSATVTGIGGLSLTPTPVYTNNTNVGTATASYSYAGDANHTGSDASSTFAITKAALSVTADDHTRAALAPNPVFTGVLTGVLGTDGISATYSAPAVTLPGAYAITPALVDPNSRLGNYTVTSTNGTLTVIDVDPPLVSVPAAALIIEATSAAGATVNFASQVHAVDAVFGPLPVTCVPASGSTFPLGTTLVQCIAVDGAGNLGAASFDVTVEDTTPPSLTALDVTAVATDPLGIAVTYAPMGQDTVSGEVASVCSPTSGTVFTIGDHTVSCQATDEAGNVSAAATFTVHVLDGVVPVVTVPAAVTAEATGATGATVTFAVTATDNVDETLTASCAPASGTVFALGDTLVTCSATDSGLNTGTATFTVTVTDTSAPVLQLPTVEPVVSTTPTIAVTYTVSAADVVDGTVTATCTPASGAEFPVGTTTVTCTATDASGSVAEGTFTVRVTDGVSPVVTVDPAGDRTVEATSSAGAVVTFTATATDNRDADLVATCSPASGTTFALGAPTLVTCSATDLDGNTGRTTFSVTVVDTTPPALTLPAPITQTTEAASGAAVTFSATAADLVDGTVPVTCTPASGATFVVGTTTVNCTASDTRGNPSTGSFTVTVTRLDNVIGRFVAFSKDNTRLRSQVTVVTGDIGANQADTTRSHGHRREGDDDRDDITVQIGERAKMQQATSRVVGDTIKLQSRASVYNVVTNNLINRSGIVLGTITNPMTVPYLTMPAFPTVAAGGSSITVKKNTSRILAAGAYGVVKVENGATLILTGGLYQMLSLDVDQSGTVLLRGASQVRIKRELDTDSKAKIILDQNVPGLKASQMVFYVEGTDESCSHRRRDDDGDESGAASVHIGQNNVVQANIYAANGTLWLMSKTQATGSFIAQHVRIGERVTLTLDSAFRQ